MKCFKVTENEELADVEALDPQTCANTEFAIAQVQRSIKTPFTTILLVNASGPASEPPSYPYRNSLCLCARPQLPDPVGTYQDAGLGKSGWPQRRDRLPACLYRSTRP